MQIQALQSDLRGFFLRTERLESKRIGECQSRKLTELIAFIDVNPKKSTLSDYYDLFHFLGLLYPLPEKRRRKSGEVNRLSRAEVSTARSFSSCLSGRYLITVPRPRSLYI